MNFCSMSGWFFPVRCPTSVGWFFAPRGHGMPGSGHAMTDNLLHFIWIISTHLRRMGTDWRPPLKPLGIILEWCLRGFSGGRGLIRALRCQEALSSRKVWSLESFQAIHFSGRRIFFNWIVPCVPTHREIDSEVLLNQTGYGLTINDPIGFATESVRFDAKSEGILFV